MILCPLSAHLPGLITAPVTFRTKQQRTVLFPYVNHYVVAESITARQTTDWFLDQMEHSGRVAAGVLRAGLTTLVKMGRRRMSQEEIEQRYQSWNTRQAIA